jgi:hypothetical protein
MRSKRSGDHLQCLVVFSASTARQFSLVLYRKVSVAMVVLALQRPSRAVHARRPAEKRTGGKLPSISPLTRSPSMLCRKCCCKAEEERIQTELERIIRRKSTEIQSQIDELGLEWLEEKLQDSVAQQAQLPEDRQFHFGRMLTAALPQVCVPGSQASPKFLPI